MSLLTTKRLLVYASRLRHARKRTIPQKEIKKRLQKLKKLSGKISPINIKKDINELERHIHDVFQLENELMKKNEKEQSEISSLKRQVAALKDKLEKAQDTNLQKKVDRLSFLLGDLMAKHETKRDIESKKIIQQAIKEKQKEPVIPLPQRIFSLENKLRILKEAGQLAPEQQAAFEQRILALKEKMQKNGNVKHTMLMKATNPSP